MPNRLINSTLHIHIRIHLWLAIWCIMTCIMIVSHTNRLDNFSQSPCTVPSCRPGGGGYSLYDGWYICAAVLTPFFDPLGTKLDLFGVFFLIHQHKNDLLGTNPRKIRSFWPQNTIFPSIFLGPIFSGPRHTASNFRTEYPPGLQVGWLVGWIDLYTGLILPGPQSWQL